MYKTIKIFAISIAFCLLCVLLQGQEPPMTPEQQEKEMYENTQKMVDRYAEEYKLEYWQVFYVDSIFMANNTGLMEEIQKLQAQMVSNADLYVSIQQKWKQKTEDALKKVFTPEQWEKYMKINGPRKKKGKK